MEKWRVRDEDFPFWMSIPRGDLGFRDVLEIRTDLKEAMEYAGRARVDIPDAGEGWGRLLDDYLKSRHHRFHKYFYSASHDPSEIWHRTYLALDPRSIPPCGGIALGEPNPRLLNPTQLQTLCRVLLADNWHPRHIGGLVRAHYERDLRWNIDRSKYDPSLRADLWARVYSGMVLLGVDTLEDFTCPAYRRKGSCPEPDCGFNLAAFGARLRARDF